MAILCALFSACATENKNAVDPMASFQQALKATDPKIIGSLQPGSDQEKQAIRRFSDFFSVLSEENVRKKVRDVYAQDVWFNDTLKTIHGIDDLEKYLLRSAANTDSCTVDIQDVASKDGEYYFRWIMHIKFKKLKKGQVQDSIGITHIRFNKEGKVSFHQDYWDSASGFYEKLPFVGGMIRWVKKKI